MVTSGTGHDRCPSQLFRAHSAPGATSPVTTKKLAKSNLVSREGQKNLGRKRPATAATFFAPVFRLSEGGDKPGFPAHIPSMGQYFEVVEVTSDDLLRGLPKKQLWVAAAPPEQAIALVLAAVPEGWTAVLTDDQLEPDQVELLNLTPGDVRELTR
jgi:hypothetical protein